MKALLRAENQEAEYMMQGLDGKQMRTEAEHSLGRWLYDENPTERLNLISAGACADRALSFILRENSLII